MAALRNPNTRRVYEAISGEPGLAQSHLVRRMGQSRATARWHVDRLASAGLVNAERRGHAVHYYPNEWDRAAATYDARHAVEVA